MLASSMASLGGRLLLLVNVVVSVNLGVDSKSDSLIRSFSDAPTASLLREEHGARHAMDSELIEIKSGGAVHTVGHHQEPKVSKDLPGKHKPDVKGAVDTRTGPPRSAGAIQMHVVKSKQPQLPADPTKLKEHGALPLWAQLLCGTATTALIMGLYFVVKGRLTAHVPRGLDQERLEIVLQETEDKMDTLKAELEALQQQQEEAARMAEGLPDADAEVRQARSMQDKADRRARALREAAENLAEQTDSLKAGAERVNETFRDGIESGRGMLENFTATESRALYDKMQSAVSDGNVPAWEAPDWMTANEDEDCIDLPPVMQLMQGAVATRSIAVVKYACHWKSTINLVMIVLSVVTFIKDWKKHCIDIEVWVWHIGHLSSNSLDIFARTIITFWCSKALRQLARGRDELEKQDEAMKTGNDMLDITGALKRGADNYFESFFKYQRIVGSWTYLFLQVITFFNLCWGGFGLWVSVHDIIIDSLACNANFALGYMHCYAFFYVVLLTWNIIGLVLTIVGHLSGSKLVTTPILKLAKKFDDDTMQGIPVALTVIESFVLKNSSGALGMMEKEAKSDIRRLHDRLEKLDEKMTERSRIRDQLKQVARTVRTQEEYMDRYQNMMAETFDQARPLVGLLAAHVHTDRVAGDDEGDPTASTSSLGAAIRMSAARASARRQQQGRGSEARRQQQGRQQERLAALEESEEDSEETAAEDVEAF